MGPSSYAFRGIRPAYAHDLYEVRPRKDHHRVGLISAALRFGRLWYAEPNAVSNSTRDLRPGGVAIGVDDKGRLVDQAKIGTRPMPARIQRSPLSVWFGQP